MVIQVWAGGRAAFCALALRPSKVSIFGGAAGAVHRYNLRKVKVPVSKHTLLRLHPRSYIFYNLPFSPFAWKKGIRFRHDRIQAIQGVILFLAILFLLALATCSSCLSSKSYPQSVAVLIYSSTLPFPHPTNPLETTEFSLATCIQTQTKTLIINLFLFATTSPRPPLSIGSSLSTPMSMDGTRRSSRARTSQSTSQLSSATSSSSGRAERSTRAFTKTGSPQKSTGSGSLSSEPPEDSTATTASSDDITLLRRRSTRGKDDDRDKNNKTELLDMANASDENEIQEDDEAVRCVCGYEEYPGPPLIDDDAKNHALKDAIDLERIFNVDLTDEMAGFFVQCDVCKVWEHGLCVGIANEDASPEEYYCEMCRKDLHKIYTASNGQKYTIYLPMHRPSRNNSRAASAVKEGTRSPKVGDAKSTRGQVKTATQTSSKRRSTMNSRDAAYDEEEQLRRAIEASKEDAIIEEAEPPTRRPKRSRDEDDDKQLDSNKRQKTNSKSPSPPAEAAPVASREESDDESALRNGSSKKSYRNAARNQREKAERDERREEQERKRAEAASKRKGRAERRRADDSDPSEEMPLATRAAINRTTESAQPPEMPTVSSQPAPDTPPANPPPASFHKKKAASHHKRKGRNQYTKDRDNHDNEESPARSMSRDVTHNHNENGTTLNKSSGHEGGSRNHKSKGGMSSKITMSDMKRRAHNILEFITRTQVELANEPLSEKNSPRQTTTEVNTNGNIPAIKVNGSNSSNGGTPPTETGTAGPSKEFKDLNCVEMMDALTRELVKWQQEFAPS